MNVADPTAPAPQQGLPLGLRLNNPGNLEGDGIAWDGKTGMHGPYVVFATMQDGANALCKDLHNKWLRGLQTPRAIVAAYAPAADHNPVDAYADFIAEHMGIPRGLPGFRARADVKLDLSDLYNLARFADALIRFEQGGRFIMQRVLYRAAARALRVNEPSTIPGDSAVSQAVSAEPLGSSSTKPGATA